MDAPTHSPSSALPARTLIAGGGFVGAALARRLREEGSKVCLLVRTAESARALAAEGLEAHALDLGSPLAPALLRELPPPEAIVACASTRGGEEADYRHVYLEGTRNLLTAFPGARIIFTGSISVYAQQDGSVVTESSETNPLRATGRILLEAERLILRAGGCVLRLGGLYGAERWAARDRFLAGQAVLGANADAFLNLIHRNDAVSALILLLRTTTASGIYNATDGTPITRRQLYAMLAAHYGKSCPPAALSAPEGRRGESHKQVQSQRLTALGWSPTFPEITTTLASEE